MIKPKGSNLRIECRIKKNMYVMVQFTLLKLGIVMNKVSPKGLRNSKWTKVEVHNKEKHFIITVVKFDDEQNVIECRAEAIFTNNEYSIDWRELKNSCIWRIGWK
jgi:tryptophan-rich hypothetical protein